MVAADDVRLDHARRRTANRATLHWRMMCLYVFHHIILRSLLKRLEWTHYSFQAFLLREICGGFGGLLAIGIDADSDRIPLARFRVTSGKERRRVTFALDSFQQTARIFLVEKHTDLHRHIFRVEAFSFFASSVSASEMITTLPSFGGGAAAAAVSAAIAAGFAAWGKLALATAGGVALGATL